MTYGTHIFDIYIDIIYDIQGDSKKMTYIKTHNNIIISRNFTLTKL